jgi:hypothetical protein
VRTMRYGFWNVPAEMSVGHTAEAEVLLAEVLLVDVLLGDVAIGVARVGVDAVAVGVGVGVVDDDEEEGGFPRAVQPNPTLMVMISQP